jgi:hypothetical protein
MSKQTTTTLATQSQAYTIYQLALKGKSQQEIIELTQISRRNVQWYFCTYGLNEIIAQANAFTASNKSKK